MLEYKNIEINRQELIDLLSDMVRIESINPLFGKGGSGESGMVSYIRLYLDELKIDYELQEALPGRENIVARIPGKGKGSLCFEAHMDTVTVENMTILPFDPKYDGSRLYGRGSVDDKACLAALMYVLKLIKVHDLRSYADIVFVAAAEEEYSYKGVLRLLKENRDYSAAVVGEATGLNIYRACKGNVRFKIITHGKAGHSSRPWEGYNAIDLMGEVLHIINHSLKTEYDKRIHPLLGPPTFNTSIISGGKLINIIPEYCEIQVDRRTLPGESFETVKEEITACLRNGLSEDDLSHVEICDPFAFDYSMETDEDSQIVKTAENVCSYLKLDSKVMGASFSCDASKFVNAGIPAIIFGPGNIVRAHSDEEYVEVDELCEAARAYLGMCMEFRP